jgi:hypothetical protein
MIRRITLHFAAILLLLIAGHSMAAEVGVQVVFTDGEASIIRAYYHDGHATQPGKKKGKHGQKTLPPGIARNLARGKPLPPGIAKQVIPTGLIDLLPPPPRGFERIAVSGKVLLVEIATQVIHDVLEDVILDR